MASTLLSGVHISLEPKSPGHFSPRFFRTFSNRTTLSESHSIPLPNFCLFYSLTYVKNMFVFSSVHFQRSDFFDAIILECCFPDQHACATRSSQLISYRNEPCYRVYMIPVRNVVGLHTGTKLSYRYKNRSELVPVRHFLPVSCKQIQSHKWEPG